MRHAKEEPAVRRLHHDHGHQYSGFKKVRPNILPAKKVRRLKVTFFPPKRTSNLKDTFFPPKIFAPRKNDVICVMIDMMYDVALLDGILTFQRTISYSNKTKI